MLSFVIKYCVATWQEVNETNYFELFTHCYLGSHHAGNFSNKSRRNRRRKTAAPPPLEKMRRVDESVE